MNTLRIARTAAALSALTLATVTLPALAASSSRLPAAPPPDRPPPAGAGGGGTRAAARPDRREGGLQRLARAVLRPLPPHRLHAGAPLADPLRLRRPLARQGGGAALPA